MTHEEILNALPAYALGALDRDEHNEVAAHVKGCATCAAELEALDRVVTAVGLDEPPVTPPAHLKARVMARVAAEPSPVTAGPRSTRSLQWGWLAVAASIAAAALTSVWALGLRSEVLSLREEVAASSSQASRLREELASLRRDWSTLTRAMDVIKAPDVMRVDLKGQGSASEATARAYWSTRGMILTAGRLPVLPPGRVYQLWTIVGSTPSPSSTFTPDASGAASVTIATVDGAVRPDAFGVTIEPAGGSTTPTLPIVLVGSSR